MADGWLQRVLAVDPCPGCGRLVGEMCVREDEADDGVAMVCTSRIQAAEEQYRLAPQQFHRFPRMDITWQHGRWTKTCKRCGTLTSGERGHAYYSHDDGRTWTPGPDACPGRRP